MKVSYILPINFFFWYVTAFPQETTRMVRIDSLIAANESRITTVYQKTEKNRIWASHGKNPDKISVVFRFSDDSRLISSTYLSYSPGDTQMIINLYFDSDILIKVRTIDFDMNNRPTEYVYFFDQNRLINKAVESLGIHKSIYYIEWAKRIRKSLRKKPIRFP